MSGLLVVFGLPFVIVCAPLIRVFGIPPAIDWLASRLPRRPKTPGAILAFSMMHPKTTGDWMKEISPRGTEYVNDKMGIRLERRSYSGGFRVDFPTSWRDEKLLRRASRTIDRRIEAERRADALESVSQQFERAYSPHA